VDILDLPAFTVIDIQQNNLDLHFTLETIEKPSSCPRCCAKSGNLVGYGRDMQLFMDTPMHGKRVGLHLKRRRMLCRDCKSTFFEPLDDMDDRRHATKRLIDYIEKRMLRETFVKVADEVGVDERTIRSIFNDFMARKQRAYGLVPTLSMQDAVDLAKSPRVSHLR
jgi:transposase